MKISDLIDELKTRTIIATRIYKHSNKILELRGQFSQTSRRPTWWRRSILVVLFGFFSFLLLTLTQNSFEGTWLEETRLPDYFQSPPSNSGRSIVSVYQLIISAPIFFILWLLRDRNRIREIENKRKDTNLSEFQQLQQWATGNSNSEIPISTSLRIAALHSLRDYLKGEYGETFKRPAFDIFVKIKF